MSRLHTLLPLVLILGACTRYGPSKTAYVLVDPARYADWSCQAIGDELTYILDRFDKLHLTTRNALSDASAVGGILLPPLVAFIDFQATSEDDDYSHLAAHAVALSRAGRDKGCPNIPEVNIEQPNP